jgi:hypothetical protein
MAGWLFADLFLFLLIAGLASIPAPPAASTGHKAPAPSASPSAPAAHDQGLNPHYLTIYTSLTPEEFRVGQTSELVTEVDADLSRMNPQHRLVGFVLVFASDSDVGRAIATAAQALNLLRQRSSAFSLAQGFGYWSGSGDDFEFKVFLLN